MSGPERDGQPGGAAGQPDQTPGPPDSLGIITKYGFSAAKGK